MNWRRILGIGVGLLICGAASAMAGAAGGQPSPHAARSTPASGLNLSLPGGADSGQRLVPNAPPARSAFDSKMPDGHQASPICRNGVRSTSYQMVDGKMVYKCD